MTCTGGAVYIDGMDVRNLRLESLRTKVCYLLQDAMLFDRTLKENLLLGNPLASARELHRALEIADMKELLRRLPRGWDTPRSEEHTSELQSLTNLVCRL